MRERISSFLRIGRIVGRASAIHGLPWRRTRTPFFVRRFFQESHFPQETAPLHLPLHASDRAFDELETRLRRIERKASRAGSSAGAGYYYYLVRLAGSCAVGSWQSVLGMEPGRDQILP